MKYIGKIISIELSFVSMWLDIFTLKTQKKKLKEKCCIVQNSFLHTHEYAFYIFSLMKFAFYIFTYMCIFIEKNYICYDASSTKDLQ